MPFRPSNNLMTDEIPSLGTNKKDHTSTLRLRSGDFPRIRSGASADERAGDFKRPQVVCSRPRQTSETACGHQANKLKPGSRAMPVRGTPLDFARDEREKGPPFDYAQDERAGGRGGPSTIGSSANGSLPPAEPGRIYWSRKLRIFRDRLRMLQLTQRLSLDLPDPLAGHRELLPDLLQRMIGVHPDAEAHPQHALLAGG